MSVTITFSDWRPAIRPLAPDAAVAAIGDVHGQDDLFGALIEALINDLTPRSVSPTIIQLGDLIDRGPASVQALRRARRGLPGLDFVTLMGNHEDCMIRAVGGDQEAARQWFGCGGTATLAEVGISSTNKEWRNRFEAEIGDATLRWATNLPAAYRIGDLLFVHAGIDPNKTLSQQYRATLMWTRAPFLQSSGPYADEVAVIHGHTPQRAVDLDHPHRINLDTGAYQTGRLTALMIVGDRMRVVQASR